MRSALAESMGNTVALIQSRPAQTLEYEFNKNVVSEEDGLALAAALRRRLAENDIPPRQLGWYYAWLVSTEYFLGDYGGAREHLRRCADFADDPELRALSRKFALLFGFDGFYSDWTAAETDHFIFHSRPPDTDGSLNGFIALREAAYLKIQAFFQSRLHRKIDFFIWDQRQEAFAVLGRPLGFAIPQYYLIHSARDQSVGHEMTHIIAHYIDGFKRSASLVCEGVAVLFDQHAKDNAQIVKSRMEQYQLRQISLRELWENFYAYPSGLTYPLSAFFMEKLLTAFGKDRFMELLKDQSYESARAVCGEALEDVIRQTEAIFNT